MRIRTSSIHYEKEVLWAMIPNCNLRCSYCYFGNKQNSFSWRTRTSITKEDHLTFARNLVSSSVKRVYIAGGEPLQIKYLTNIIRILNEGGIQTVISTNGVLLKEPLLRELSASGLNAIFFSIDSSTPEYHNKFRGHWQETMNNLKIVINYKIKNKIDQVIGVYMVISKENITKISEMTDFLSNVGVNYFVFQPIFLSPEHPLFQKLDIITSQKSKSLFIKEIRKIRNIKYNIILPSTLYTDILKTITEKNNISISNCFGGRSLFFVDPLGDIWPCPSSHRKTNQDKIGNIKNLSKQGVRQIFDSKQELNNSCKFADRDCVCMFELKSSQIWNNH